MIIFKIIKRIISGVMLVIGIGFVVLLLVGIVGFFWHPNEPPSMQDAPWVVQTSSRTYYAKELTAYNKSPAISNYWYSDGGKWYFVSETRTKKAVETPTDKLVNGKWCLVFDKKLYPEVNIYRRVK